jgi:anti-sigma factor RsiW
MNTQQNMEERLWGFIDGLASPQEKTVIEKLVEEDAAWKAKYAELLQLNEMLHGSETEQPSLRFTKNVMKEIAKLHIAPATKNYLNKKIIWGIGFFFIAMLLAILVYGFGQMLAAPASVQSTLGKNLDRIGFSKFFDNTWLNALMMVNVVIGLFLFDNYLSNRRKHFKKA